MFAIIETNGASHIAIHVPHDGADKTLPALAAMLENNAVFIRKSWPELSVAKPNMSIILGDKFSAEDTETAELVISANGGVIGDDFVIASPDVFVSNKKAIDRKDAEISRLNKELSHTKAQLDMLRETVAAVGRDSDQD